MSRKKPEAALAQAQEQYSHLEAPEYKADQIWAVQFVNSATCLGCLAEINGTEFHHTLKAESLIKVYQDQLAYFERNTIPTLQNEGISKVIIDKLHEIYHTRAFVEAWEIDTAINRYRPVLGSKKLATYRITESAHNFWPLWKSLAFKPFTGSMLRPEYLSTEQTLGRHPKNNEEAAAVNVRQFNGVVAFINAVNRGLTKEEISKLKVVLAQGPVPDRLPQSWKDEIEQEIVAIEELAQTDLVASKRLAEKLWGANSKKPAAKLFILSRLSENLLITNYKMLGRDDPFFGTDEHDEDHYDEHALETEEVTLVEGEDYFTSEAARQKAREELRLKFLQELDDSVKAKPEEFKDKDGFASRFAEALKFGLGEDVQDNLYVLHLLRTSQLTDRQQDEVLSIFRANPNDGPADGRVLLDALNPHPIAKFLWSERIRALCLDLPEYTREFDEGSDSNWIKQAQWPKGTKELLGNKVFNAPPINRHGYNTAFDDVCHMKLLRLAVDWLDMDLHTVEGMAAFDNLVHEFDISPGEDTLERTHPSPPDHHTYEELPIMKFDGWDEADEPELYEEEKALGTGKKEVAAHH